MPAIDMHQHLWPAGFLAALRSRRRPPLLEGDELVISEGRFPVDPASLDVHGRAALLDRDGVDLAVVSLQPGLGIGGLPPAEREELEEAWLAGMREVALATDGRFRALAPGRLVDGLPGACVPGSALADLDALAPLLDELERRDAFLFVHPGVTVTPPQAPGWWAPTVQYTGEMQRAYFGWLAAGRDRWPSLRVVFAILAGGAPFQLERRALRGIDVRSTLDENVYFDVATYGRRAIELCIETFGVHRLVYGSDVPVVDPAPTLQAIRGFGDAVAQLIQIDTPSALLSR